MGSHVSFCYYMDMLNIIALLKENQQLKAKNEALSQENAALHQNLSASKDTQTQLTTELNR